MEAVVVGGTPQLETVGLVVVLEEVALKVQVLAGVELLDKVMLEEDFGMPLAAAAVELVRLSHQGQTTAHTLLGAIL